MITRVVKRLPLLCILIFLHGCGEEKIQLRPLSGGFGISSKWIGVDSGPEAALYYQTNQSKPTLIWPFLRQSPVHTNGMVLFIGAVQDSEGRLSNQSLFAVQAPGPAADVTLEILKIGVELNKLEFEKVSMNTPLDVMAVANGIQIHFGSSENFPIPDFTISWEQVSKAVHTVRSKGEQHMTKKIPHEPIVVYYKID